MKTAIINGKIITDGKVLQENVVFENGVITAMTSGEVSADQVIDAAGAYVAPGFIDIHTHGAGGADFLDGTAEAFVTAAEMQARGGAATVVATVNSSNREEMLRAIRAFDEVKKRSYVGAKIAGLHFEGPYFSPAQKGAQDEKYLKDFDKEEYEEVLSKSKDILRWSAAPELRGAKEFAASMKEHGVLAAIGHSDAECTRVEEAFKEGFTHVTHLYSCTSTVHRQNAYRYAGIVEAAYLLDDMTVEIIADGAHLPPALLKLIYKLKGSGKIALVTDSIRAAGLPEGIYRIGSLENGYDVIIEEGVAKLPDRTAFAGSVALYNRLVKNMVELAGVTLPEAVRMASETPAKIIRFEKKGRLAPGYDADFTLFDETFTVLRTISEGKTVFQH